MMRGKTDRSAKSGRLTITLGKDQRREIVAMANERRTSAATVIRWALDEYIAQNRLKPRARARSVP